MPKFIKNTDDIYYVWHFFQSTVGTLQIFVIALGVGIGILGVINLMEEKHQG
ncbi:MAG: Maff2 family mobile element protein [Coprococcus sp.]